MKYYLITCHRGHCGCGNSTDITFAIVAKNLLHAMNIARKMPSVKHTRLAIYGREITKEEYNERRKINAYHRFDY